MLNLALRRATSLRAPFLMARYSSHGPGTTPDTGGPLFSTQFGVPIHKPSKGGDKAAEAKAKGPDDAKKPKSNAHKVQGGHSFAELKRLHQVRSRISEHRWGRSQADRLGRSRLSTQAN